jgi:chromosome segregation ATPase
MDAAMESPFRAMDEFDVFMDAVNRHLSLKLLIESARLQKHRQFIFITPHDLTSVASGPDVRVHRMRDPERANVSGITAQQTILDQFTQS